MSNRTLRAVGKIFDQLFKKIYRVNYLYGKEQNLATSYRKGKFSFGWFKDLNTKSKQWN